ncbi:MFS transporter [Actinoplanes derwentensis]|uniref:Na+/melibiose symporter n=1 Tax=Actinoplanes derwentensis TaxID=113562 RepID=A0A1H1QWF6_9ACTN|nr:MFS transporter [Actinoplanes derwentensis]GID87084.1 MFS transporter [Actinoplanes derwentensis]SDS27808.1 Na+/melibiose symporter [Actinoplanes derwentensis]
MADIKEPNARSAAASPVGSDDTPPVNARYIWLVVLAYLGGMIALVAPVGISLSLRIEQLLPENVEVLGYVVGIGAAASAISMPLVGMWSDRTRTRFGRRRPFSLGGTILGLIGLALMAVAPNVWVLALAWMVAQIGWSNANNSLILSQADRLPESQRGRVAGLSGFAQMIGAVIGVGIASAFIGNNFLVFLAPGFVGLVFVLLWVTLVPEADSRGLVENTQKLTLGKALSDMVFKPSAYPDFAWNWLGRLIFNFGVTFSTTFTTLFFASRVGDGGVADIGGLIAILSLLGVVATAGGALLGGMLSDRLGKRRIFVLFSGIAFTAGAITMAFGGSAVGVLIGGSLMCSVGLGVFSAVDQAIVLDVLPERDTEAGRFLGINNYATSIAQAIAPVIAAPLLLIGMTGDDKNYGLLFLIAAVCTLIGGVLVTAKVRGAN